MSSALGFQKEIPKALNLQASHLQKKIDGYNKDLSHNVTRIFGRDDLHTAIPLVYHSVMGFTFLGTTIRKGWLEILIIGDTRSGKSETAVRICNHFQAGEVVLGENCTRAGLLGGLQQFGNRWQLTWGKIPKNNGKLVIIDEASGLSVEEIGNLSGVRSSGVAEITGIQSAKANSRCRLIWLSNPRNGKDLGEFNFGIQAVQDLIGRQEDMARFDVVVSSAGGEVDKEVIRSRSVMERPPHVYHSLYCRDKVHWAWTRSPEQVKFVNGSEDVIWDLADNLANTYSPKIPIVEPSEQRIKLARVAAAVAAYTFSTDKNKENLYVFPFHAVWAYKFMLQCFNKPSLAYDQFSLSFGVRPLTDELYTNISEDIETLTDPMEFVHTLSEFIGKFKRQDLKEELGYDSQELKEAMTVLRQNKLISSTAGGFNKTALCVSFLKRLKANGRFAVIEKNSRVGRAKSAGDMINE